MVKSKKTFSDQKRYPVKIPLVDWICGLREEIGSKRRPDPRLLEQIISRVTDAGVDEEFFLYVVGGCEWYFRICPRPGSVVLRKKLKNRLETSGYSPFAYPAPMQLLRYDPSLVGRYVDHRLAELWDNEHPEASRFTLQGDLERLVGRLDTPFVAATLQPVSPRRSGYQPVSEWVAASMIYMSVRKTHPKKQDATAIEIALDLMHALARPTNDNSQFHRKRKQITKRMPDLYDLFTDGLRNVTNGYRVPVEGVFEGALDPSVAWYWLARDGLQLFGSESRSSQKPPSSQSKKQRHFQA